MRGVDVLETSLSFRFLLASRLPLQNAAMAISIIGKGRFMRNAAVKYGCRNVPLPLFAAALHTIWLIVTFASFAISTQAAERQVVHVNAVRTVSRLNLSPVGRLGSPTNLSL